MLRLPFSAFFSFAIASVLAVFLSCSSGSDPGGNGEGSCGAAGDDGWPFDSYGEELEPSPSLESLMEQEFDGTHHFDKIIYIKYKNGSEPEITNDYSGDVNITPNGEDITVMVRNGAGIYSFILSGTAINGSLKFTGKDKKELYLNGVSITNSKGPAINNQGGTKTERLLVHLVNGTSNYLADGTNYKCKDFETGDTQKTKGAFFSEGKLEFEGSGSLEVKGRCHHAIAVDEDFEINNGRITVSEAAGDGIHVNDRIKIKGGVLDVKSNGDAIQNEKPPSNNDDNPEDWMRIVGGKIKAQTTGIKSHGIAAKGRIRIDSTAVVQISVKGNGSKGIKSSYKVDFQGGKTSINVSGTKYIDPKDEDGSTPAGIKLDTINTNLSITGGELTIKSLGCKAKGINIANGTISNGTVNIEADDDGIKVQPQGGLQITGGTGSIKSAKKKAIDGTYTQTGNGIRLIDGGF